jgi:hypothetical protein
MSKVKPIPDSSSVVIPMLVCCDVAAALGFCKTTFAAVEAGRRPGRRLHRLVFSLADRFELPYYSAISQLPK